MRCSTYFNKQPTHVKELVIPPHLHFRLKLWCSFCWNVHKIVCPFYIIPERLVQVTINGQGFRCSRTIGDVMSRIDGIIGWWRMYHYILSPTLRKRKGGIWAQSQFWSVFSSLFTRPRRHQALVNPLRLAEQSPLQPPAGQAIVNSKTAGGPFQS